MPPRPESPSTTPHKTGTPIRRKSPTVNRLYLSSEFTRKRTPGGAVTNPGDFNLTSGTRGVQRTAALRHYPSIFLPHAVSEWHSSR